jgi:hypothetical protein
MNFEEFSIIDEKRKQDEVFIGNVSCINKNLAKQIIVKYDIYNSCFKKSVELMGDIDSINILYTNYLKKREDFFKLLSMYL